MTAARYDGACGSSDNRRRRPEDDPRLRQRNEYDTLCRMPSSNPYSPASCRRRRGNCGTASPPRDGVAKRTWYRGPKISQARQSARQAMLSTIPTGSRHQKQHSRRVFRRRNVWHDHEQPVNNREPHTREQPPDMLVAADSSHRLSTIMELIRRYSRTVPTAVRLSRTTSTIVDDDYKRDHATGPSRDKILLRFVRSSVGYRTVCIECASHPSGMSELCRRGVSINR